MSVHFMTLMRVRTSRMRGDGYGNCVDDEETDTYIAHNHLGSCGAEGIIGDVLQPSGRQPRVNWRTYVKRRRSRY